MTKTLAIAGTVMLAMATCYGTAASPSYDVILSVTIILALGALICFCLVFPRLRRHGKTVCAVGGCLAFLLVVQACLRLAA